jgi:hypothetical protein
MSTIPLIEQSILNHLDSIDDIKEKIEVIDDLIHRLQFERRLTDLSEAERKSMMCELFDCDRKALAECKTEADRDKLFESISRTMYFREIAWLNYLNGHAKEKPFVMPDEPATAPDAD